MKLRVVTLGDFHNYYSYFLAGSSEGAVLNGAWHYSIALFGQTLDNIKKQLDFFKPQIVLCHCIFNQRPHNRDEVFTLLRWIRNKLKAFVFYHMGDARSEPRYPHDISDIVDAVLLNRRDMSWEKIWKVQCYHWPYMALDQDEISLPLPSHKWDVVFTGSLNPGEGHHRSRSELVEKLKQGTVKVKTFPDTEFGNTRFMTPEISSSSNIILGTQMGGDISGYLDVRPFQYSGAGALYFHDKHPNMDMFFEDGVHYVSYKNSADFFGKHKYYTENKDDAKKIRESAFKFSQRWHSSKVRMKYVIDVALGKDPEPLNYLK